VGRIRISEKGGREGPSKDPTAPQSEHDAFIFESVFDQVSKRLEEKSDWIIKGAPRACMCEEGGRQALTKAPHHRSSTLDFHPP